MSKYIQYNGKNGDDNDCVESDCKHNPIPYQNARSPTSKAAADSRVVASPPPFLASERASTIVSPGIKEKQSVKIAPFKRHGKQ